jgi:hypothetical protein
LQRGKQAVKSFSQDCNENFTPYLASCKIATTF